LYYNSINPTTDFKGEHMPIHQSLKFDKWPEVWSKEQSWCYLFMGSEVQIPLAAHNVMFLLIYLCSHCREFSLNKSYYFLSVKISVYHYQGIVTYLLHGAR